jgi:hypothetical protein
MKIFDPVVYLQELINEKFQVKIINFLSNYKEIISRKNDSCRIFYASDNLIEKTFELKQLQLYFEESAWGIVLDRLNNKRLISTCQICYEIPVCLIQSICCSKFDIWYHWKCAKVSTYHRSGTSKNWHCSKCKGELIKKNKHDLF